MGIIQTVVVGIVINSNMVRETMEKIKMEKLEIEFIKHINGEILVRIENLPSQDTTLSRKDICSLIEDLILASSSIDDMSIN